MSMAMPSEPRDVQRDAAEALPAGTRLAEFELRDVLGLGGFGIVYLAWDHALEREVALKEYMPVSLAGRGQGPRITLRSQAQRDTFDIGLRSFVNEARMLARFDHPSLVKVYRFWEDHGTAYMVMPYYRGRTLRQVRQAMVDAPDEAHCRQVLEPLLSALSVLHAEGVYHRDIAPDNIIVGDDGTPVLLDFGAARQVINRTQALTAILKPNFAPLEQYADMASMRQGPWTDFYALGATMYCFITSQAPLPAAGRALHDEMPALVGQPLKGFSTAFLATIDWMLSLRPTERPQSVAQLREALATGVVPTAWQPVSARDAQQPSHAPEVPRYDPTLPLPDTRTAPPPPPPAAMPRRLGWAPWGAVLAGTAVVGVLAWWAARPDAPARSTSIAAGAAVAQPVSDTALPVPVRSSRMPLEPLAPGSVAKAIAADPVTAPPAGAQSAAAAGDAFGGSLAEAASPPPHRVRAVRRAVGAGPLEGPSERCSERRFVARLVCMKRECLRPALRSHPECRRMAEMEQAQHRSD